MSALETLLTELEQAKLYYANLEETNSEMNVICKLNILALIKACRVMREALELSECYCHYPDRLTHPEYFKDGKEILMLCNKHKALAEANKIFGDGE